VRRDERIPHPFTHHVSPIIHTATPPSDPLASLAAPEASRPRAPR
jgi:hypothetical protein